MPTSIEQVAHYFTDTLIKKNVAVEEDREYYNYCFELMFSTFLGIGSILLLSIWLNLFVETICYLVAFISLRRTSGGYHADTNLGCFLLSLLFYAVFAGSVATFSPKFYLPLAVGEVLFSILVVYMLSPVEHKNRPFTSEERALFFKWSRTLSLIYSIIILLLLILFPFLCIGRFTFCFSQGLLVNAISLLIPSILYIFNKGG